jgi:hypothetical protein
MTRYLLFFDSYGLVFLCGVLSDERTNLSFVYADGPHQQSSLGPSPLGLMIIFYSLRAENSLLSPPTTRRATVKGFDPASTRVTREWLSLSLSLMLRPTVSRPVCPAIKHPSGAYDQLFITFWQLRFCFCGAHSLTRGRACLFYMLLGLASAVLLRSESLCSRDHILLSHVWDFPFRRLLRLAGSRWRYSTPPPHGLVVLV